MAVQQVQSKRSEDAYRQAREIINASWLEAGVTQEELNEGDELADILDRLMGSGYPEEGIRAVWEADYPSTSDKMPFYHALWPIAESVFAPEDSILALIWYRLAIGYDANQTYQSAIPLFTRVLKVWNQTLGPEHPRAVEARNRLHQSYDHQIEKLRAEGRNSEANALLKTRALQPA